MVDDYAGQLASEQKVQWYKLREPIPCDLDVETEKLAIIRSIVDSGNAVKH